MLVVVAGLSALGIALAMVALAERSPGVETVRGALLRYHWFSIAVGGCFSLGFCLLFALLLLKDGNTTPEALRNGGVAFCLVVGPAGWFTVRACRARVLLFPGGVLKLAPGMRRKVRWAEVEKVTFEPLSARYRVRCRCGDIFVSQFMAGQREFAEAALRYAPSSRLSCERELKKLAQ